jgi:anti-anti-sigma factor
MELTYEGVDNDVLVLEADGELNVQTAERFFNDVEKIVDSGLQRVVVDCAKLDFVNSYGLSVLIRIHKHMAGRGGEVKLANVSSGVYDVFDVVKFAKLFNIYPTRQEAIAAFT